MSTEVAGCSSGVHQLVPGLEVGGRGLDLELAADELVQSLRMQQSRDLVDAVHVHRGDNRLLLQVGEQRDLAAFVIGQRPVGAAQHDVGLDPDLTQLLDRVLRRLGLDLARRRNIGHQGEVHETGVVAAELQAHLPDGFQERQGLDIAHRAADLDDGHVRIAGSGANEMLDLVGDVRDDLHCATQVVAPALLANDTLVDLAGGEVVALQHPGVDEALVVAEVEIGLGAVLGDEDFAVLERAHGARIDVDVGVELEEGELDAAGFENCRQGGGSDTFAKGGDYAAGDKDEFSHARASTICWRGS